MSSSVFHSVLAVFHCFCLHTQKKLCTSNGALTALAHWLNVRCCHGQSKPISVLELFTPRHICLNAMQNCLPKVASICLAKMGFHVVCKFSDSKAPSSLDLVGLKIWPRLAVWKKPRAIRRTQVCAKLQKNYIGSWNIPEVNPYRCEYIHLSLLLKLSQLQFVHNQLFFFLSPLLKTIHFCCCSIPTSSMSSRSDCPSICPVLAALPGGPYHFHPLQCRSWTSSIHRHWPALWYQRLIQWQQRHPPFNPRHWLSMLQGSCRHPKDSYREQ